MVRLFYIFRKYYTFIMQIPFIKENETQLRDLIIHKFIFKRIM